MKSVSLAMGTYNGGKYLAEQLDSFTKQSVLPCELVVTDDGSTDNTVDIIADFATKAPFPVHIEKNEKNLGYRGNFIKAAGLCKGDLIAFSDQDDVWLPNKIERCLSAFDDDDVMLAYHNARVVDANLQPFDYLDERNAPHAINPALSLDPTHFGLGFTQVFKRELLAFDHLWPLSGDHSHIDKPEAHDQWYFFLASCLGTIVYFNEPLALYRRHETNTTALNDIPRIVRKILVLMSSNIDRIKARERAAFGRAKIMDQAQDMLTGTLRQHAQDAAKGYHLLADSLRMRRELYESRSYNFAFRMSQISAVMRLGGYKPKEQWGSGKQALARDIFRGIIFPLHV